MCLHTHKICELVATPFSSSLAVIQLANAKLTANKAAAASASAAANDEPKLNLMPPSSKLFSLPLAFFFGNWLNLISVEHEAGRAARL